MLTERIEILIIKNLIENPSYAQKVLPFIKDEYFNDLKEKVIVTAIKKFIETYKNLPTKQAILLACADDQRLNDESYKKVYEIIDSLEIDDRQSEEWLLKETEKFCKNMAFENALMACAEIVADNKSKLDRGMAPKIMSDALSVCFEANVGHDYLEHVDARIDEYHKKTEKIPFDLDMMNKITMNGVERKTLNIVMASTGIGKSLFLCHLASAYLAQGLNVLYITLEMSEKMIAARIDANLMNIRVHDLFTMPKENFLRKFDKVRGFSKGKLIIKEYPTAAANVNHFRTLCNEILLKTGTKIDVILLDYLNIASSSRVKQGAGVNSYTIVKSIAEEVRGLAVEQNVVCWTATQSNRSAVNDTDPTLEQVSESFGIAHTADIMLGLISTEELEAANQIMVKQLKNRYNSPVDHKRFVLGIDRPRFKLFDANPDDVVLPESGNKSKTKKEEKDDTPGFDKGKFGKGMKGEQKPFSALDDVNW